ncbi:MAG: HlyD family efflux transporter periplasmic adaptor subunit [Ignavibacteriae bacterium]|nr:HlyD family efflux transporter periplasmic adaptor subunit [Ignavibacteriota bacterium]NOG97726.1 HlyD family efflux transporter periplasmic adaptor subunit [Ignavibacteriota bacterium]
MNNKSKYIFVVIGIVIGAALMFAASALLNSGNTDYMHKKNDSGNKKPGIHSDENSVTLTNSEIEELGIQLETVGSVKLQMHTGLTGEIVPNPDKLAHLVPRFTGIVKSVHKAIGDRVEKDEVIAVIESNESLVTYDVKSSIKGVVLEMHMTPGELIGDEKHVVTVADLTTVWAELNVYQKDLNKIKVGQSALIYFDELDNAIKGSIFYLSPTLDKHTRTATARVRLNNFSGYWKPGMFIAAKVLTNFIDVEKAVKLNAIQNFENRKVVFVKDGKAFKPKQVTIGKTNTDYAEILSGLNIKQIYIAEGAFVIKSELLKESFGGGHAH